MRILHVIPTVAPGYGGPSVAIRGMARATAALGAEVTVATTDADGGGRLPVPLDRPVLEDGVEYRYFARTLPGSWNFSVTLTRWLYENVARYDVLHVHAVFAYTTAAACRSAAFRGVPYVLRPLGMLDRWSLSQRSWKKQPYIALVERTHLRRAGAIHATSTDEGQNIAALGYGARVHVIPLGVDLPSGSPRAVRPADGPLRLLFLSRLHPKKGLPLLLGAVAELSRGGANVELVVAGSGSEAYRAELSALCDRLGISERVRFLGHVEGDSKTEALRAADVFVLPSYQENFGIAIAEAMAAGVPVIVSDRVALADEIRSSGAGMVVPCEASAIAGAISRLGRAPEERYRMGENGIKLVRKRYSWDRTSRLLLDLYTQLANEARC